MLPSLLSLYPLNVFAVYELSKDQNNAKRYTIHLIPSINLNVLLIVS